MDNIGGRPASFATLTTFLSLMASVSEFASAPLAPLTPPPRLCSAAPGEDYPLICEACMGPNPYVRMTKAVNGAECKISKRPFTSFRWKPGKQGYKQTVVSYAIAAQKNICQCCMTDLTYGLPVQIRDAFLRQAMTSGMPVADSVTFESMPLSRVGQDYQHNLQLARMEETGGEDPHASLGTHGASEALRALAQGAAQHASSDKSSFNRALPRLCEFWIEGGCSKVSAGTWEENPLTSCVCCTGSRGPVPKPAVLRRVRVA